MIAMPILLTILMLIAGLGHVQGQAAHVPPGGPLLRLSVSPSGVIANGGLVSVSELNARLDALESEGGAVWLSPGISPGPIIVLGQRPRPLTARQRARATAFEDVVIILVRVHHLSLLGPERMPVIGWSSPRPPGGPPQ